MLVPLFGRGCFEQAETTRASFAVHLAVDLLCRRRCGQPGFLMTAGRREIMC